MASMELERTLTDGPSERPGEAIEVTRGTAVGRYFVLDMLGAGGMGVVYAAFDPELERKIALKLVLPASGGSDAGRARLLREAQALAKLSHPNVVTIHDVGTFGAQVWIAMEFVAGQTLATWATSAPRSWAERLAVLADVARGVAAAHAAGLVHRDLKPDNVMIGDDGRVRVMDFGLALGAATSSGVHEPVGSQPELARDGSSSSATIASSLGIALRSSGVSQRLTQAGSLQGSPAYMAPEQWQGRDAEAATDQFAWAVMAWELLFGERPFSGATIGELVQAVVVGQPRSPARRRGVPGWLREVIERALASEPTQRWPTMHALLAALERGRTRARRRLLAGVVAGVVALVATIEGTRRWDIHQRMTACAAAGAEIDGVWNDDARQQLRAAFVATGVKHAAATAERVMPWLDDQAAAWRQARTDACHRGTVERVWTPGLLDRAVWCLEERQMALAALVGEFARADATTVQKSVSAAVGLRAPEACMDEAMLVRQPTPPQQREGLREARARLSQIFSSYLTGRYKEGLALAVALRDAKDAPDWPPLQAAIRAQESSFLERTGAFAEAEVVGNEAYFQAASAAAWGVAVDVATQMTYNVGYRQARYAEGRAWARHARMAIVHAGDRMGLNEAARLINLANVEEAAGAYAEARLLYEQALAIREAALGPDHPAVAMSLNNLANLYVSLGEPEKGRPLHERALAIREAALGPDHPDVAMSLLNLANVFKSADDTAQARKMYERALAILEGALGPEHAEVALCMHNLADLHGSSGDHAQARALGERSLALFEKTLGPEHPHVAASLTNLAGVDQATGAYAEARPRFERALAIREKALGPEHLGVARSLANLAGLALAEGQPRMALPLLERAAKIFAAHDGVQPGELTTKLHLARALVATDGDLARAVTLATAARDGLRGAGKGAEKALAEAEQWLAEHASG